MNIFMWLGPDQMTNGLRIGKDPDQILDLKKNPNFQKRPPSGENLHSMSRPISQP